MSSLAYHLRILLEVLFDHCHTNFSELHAFYHFPRSHHIFNHLANYIILFRALFHSYKFLHMLYHLPKIIFLILQIDYLQINLYKNTFYFEQKTRP